MNYLPWIEKYRPIYINDIISHNQNIDTIKKLIKANVLPHLLFYGPPGTGKTSTILTIANELYGNNIKLMVMKLDASDDRGINSVREDIKSFADKTNMFILGVKLIILDEADSMTVDAQFALRRIIEIYSDTLRFCLICNYENKIIPAIKSRFANFRFNIINNNHINERLLYIINNENINIPTDVIKLISENSNGDLRKAINLLQIIQLQNDNINIDLCHKLLNIPYNSDIIYIISVLNNSNILYKNKYDIIYNFLETNNLSLHMLITKIFNYIINKNNEYLKPIIISKLAALENIILKKSNDIIYITGLINIFI
jgi:replication factor C subunit 3/5